MQNKKNSHKLLKFKSKFKSRHQSKVHFIVDVQSIKKLFLCIYFFIITVLNQQVHVMLSKMYLLFCFSSQKHEKGLLTSLQLKKKRKSFDIPQPQVLDIKIDSLLCIAHTRTHTEDVNYLIYSMNILYSGPVIPTLNNFL